MSNSKPRIRVPAISKAVIASPATNDVGMSARFVGKAKADLALAHDYLGATETALAKASRDEVSDREFDVRGGGRLRISSDWADTNRFDADTGPQESMSGGRDGSGRMIRHYSHDAGDGQSRGVREYDRIAEVLDRLDGVEKAVSQMAGLYVGQAKKTAAAQAENEQLKKALAYLAAHVTGQPLVKADDDDDDDENAEESNFQADGDGGTRHGEESSAAEEERDSSARRKARKASGRKSEDVAGDEQETSTDEASEEAGIKSGTVNQVIDWLSKGKLQPTEDRRKASNIRQPVKHPPYMGPDRGAAVMKSPAWRIAESAVLESMPSDTAAGYQALLQREALIRSDRLPYTAMSDHDHQFLESVRSDIGAMMEAQAATKE